MEIDISFQSYKRVYDEFNKRKPIGFSGLPNYVDNGETYVVYFAIPEFTYRCVISKKGLSRVEEITYIRSGIKVNGRLVNTIVHELKPVTENENIAEQTAEQVGEQDAK